MENIDLNIIMKHVLRVTEGYTELYEELKEVKAELAELKSGKKAKNQHMRIVMSNRK